MQRIRVFPFVRWFPPSGATLRADAIAGITVALLLIPQAMAYAQLAGLPARYGLYTAFLPMMVAALFGWSGQLHTGPVAMTSLMTASVLVSMGAYPGDPRYISTAIVLGLLAGVIRLGLGWFRLSVLVNFLSHPVISGFTSAGALIIAGSQLKTLLGVDVPRHNWFLGELGHVFRAIPLSNLATVCMGAGAIAMMVLLKRLRPRWPGVLITMVAAILISRLIGYADQLDGHVVGSIPAGLPSFEIPVVSFDSMIRLIPGAFMITLVGFMEVLAISKVISAKTREPLNLDQELVGQGMACITGSLFQCYPVSGSFSRSALNLYAGARTGFSSLFAGLMVMVVLLFLTPGLYHLPDSVLAAVIIVAVWGLVDLRGVWRIVAIDRLDGIAAWITFLSTLALAPHIVEGILIGMAVSVVFHLVRLMRPHVAILGHHPDGTFRDVQRHGLKMDPETLVVRFDGRLIFVNASHFEESILDARAEHPAAQTMILACSGINAMDATGESTLRRVIDELRRNGTRVVLAGVKGAMMDVLTRSDLLDVVGKNQIYPSIEAAWADPDNHRTSE